MSISLSEVLDLVGSLDDAPGENTPRERFRQFLKKNVTEVGQVRDYVEECLRRREDQFNRALQDLVNHLGTFLEFEVEFGRYRGVAGQIGFDGHWISPSGFHVVAETKTTEVFAIKTSTLLSYIDDLISEQAIPNRTAALGLYVVGQPDAELRQLENSIRAEDHTSRLRLVSVESLLTLAEMLGEYDVSHDDILAVIKPSGPRIDPIVNLMGTLVAAGGTPPPQPQPPADKPLADEAVGFWLAPVKATEDETAEEVVQRLVGDAQVWAFGERAPRRKDLQEGDRMCFYAGGKGVVAHATIASEPTKEPHPSVGRADQYPWSFHLRDPQLYLGNPVVVDSDLRRRLDAFLDRNPDQPWGWFVQTTRNLTAHDFKLLTREG